MKDGKQNVPISTGVSVKFLEPEFQILIWLIWRLEYRYSRLIKPYSTFMDHPSVQPLSNYPVQGLWWWWWGWNLSQLSLGQR